MFGSKVGAYPRVEHLKDFYLGRLLAEYTDIKVVGQGLSGTNTLAY